MTLKLENTLGQVLYVGLTTSSVCLAIGLALSITPGTAAVAPLLLHAGLIVLMATPFARVVVSLAEYVAQRDWIFVVLTAIVLFELIAAVIAALVFNRLL